MIPFSYIFITIYWLILLSIFFFSLSLSLSLSLFSLLLELLELYSCWFSFMVDSEHRSCQVWGRYKRSVTTRVGPLRLREPAPFKTQPGQTENPPVMRRITSSPGIYSISIEPPILFNPSWCQSKSINWEGSILLCLGAVGVWCGAASYGADLLRPDSSAMTVLRIWWDNCYDWNINNSAAVS